MLQIARKRADCCICPPFSSVFTPTVNNVFSNFAPIKLLTNKNIS